MHTNECLTRPAIAIAEIECACLDPKGGELCLNKMKPGKPRWRSVAMLTCKSLYDLGIGAKDSSNHLVAGSHRSFLRIAGARVTY